MNLEGLPRPRVKFGGTDGNAFSILSKVGRALRQAKWTNEQIKAFTAEALSGDYDHLLQTCCKYVEAE